MMKRLATTLLLVLCVAAARAQDAEQLYYALRSKVLTVKDYTADVRMKVDVSFMDVPVLQGKLYFKAPDKMRLERKGGISILPKKNLNLSLGNLIPTGKVTVLDAGAATVDGQKLKLLKVIPEDDANNIVLTKLWVDETRMLVMKTETTTRTDGTVIMSLQYGTYANYALPDKVTVFMDLKDYKLPKGVTMDYNDATQQPKTAKVKSKKGTIEIKYLKYAVNTGLADAVFAGKE